MKFLRTPVLIVALGVVSVSGQIPPPADAPRPRSPEQSAAAFRLPEGFRMEVVASEPLIASPSAVCWDEQGRLFVSEIHGYNLEGQLDIEELNKTGRLDTEVRRVQAAEKFKQAAMSGTYGAIKQLRDTDGDGRMDAADVWTTNIPPAYGMVPFRGGLVVACAPDILFLADRDGDGRAEVRTVLFTGFKVGPIERGINAPQWGMDGWIYFGRGAGGGRITGPGLAQAVELPGSDFRIKPDGSAIEPVTGNTGTFGFAMNEAGDRFTMSTGEPGRFVAPLPWRYLVRNPNAAVSGLEIPTGDRRVYPLAPPHPWRQKRADHAAYAKYYRDRYGAGDSDASGWFTSACSPMIYQDEVLPGLQGQYLVCEPSGNIIHRAVMEMDGPMIRLRRVAGEESSEFAATSDPWSHPMNLSHGPDGSIWVVDYYREIIEDYSAIPRHLQQQYGLYAGHDRGRILRLTHRDAGRVPAADMSRLRQDELAPEMGSPLFWRRQTAQRLLVERQAVGATADLRRLLRAPDARDRSVIQAIRTMEQLGTLEVDDLLPLLEHGSESVRVQVLQLLDAFLKRGDRRAMDGLLNLAEKEQQPRVLIQIALTLGESSDERAFHRLARLARTHFQIRWMDAAVLSSLHGRGVLMLEELLRRPGGAGTIPGPLAQSVAAGRNEGDFSKVLQLCVTANPDHQVAVLEGLAKGRKNAPRSGLRERAEIAALATLAASPYEPVRKAARAVEETFAAAVMEEGNDSISFAGAQPRSGLSEEKFKAFVAALTGPRDLKRGEELFLQACSACHRVAGQGHEVGPDLMGQAGLGEESLLKDILMPDERIRPGFELTAVLTRDGAVVAGILKDDGATSLTLMQANGVERVILRKDVDGVRRLGGSLMPSFADTLTPAELTSLLGWLGSQLKAAPVK